MKKNNIIDSDCSKDALFKEIESKKAKEEAHCLDNIIIKNACYGGKIMPFWFRYQRLTQEEKRAKRRILLLNKKIERYENKKEIPLLRQGDI